MTSEPKRLYTRGLPGGGYVAIEAYPVHTLFGPLKMRGQIVIERRSDDRREGHRAPIAACAEHTKFIDIIDALFPIAHSDRALAQLLERRVMISAFARRRYQIS